MFNQEGLEDIGVGKIGCRSINRRFFPSSLFSCLRISFFRAVSAQTASLDVGAVSTRGICSLLGIAYSHTASALLGSVDVHFSGGRLEDI